MFLLREGKEPSLTVAQLKDKKSETNKKSASYLYRVVSESREMVSFQRYVGGE